MSVPNKKLQVGDPAPDFTLPDQFNRPIHFAEVAGQGPIVLFFYPKDYTPGCTAEVCAFRDNYEDFKDAGATVIGVSADSTESHERFSERHRLPFILLSDAGGVVQSLYGAEKTFGILPVRITFIIDNQRTIRHIFSSQINIDKHISDALQVIQTLRRETNSGQSPAAASR